MKLLYKRLLSAWAIALLCYPDLRAQTPATAERRLDFSIFALFSGTYTGLGSSYRLNLPGYNGAAGRNLTLSAGADLGVLNYRGYELAAEVRGGYPVAKGQVDAQKSLLGGIRVSHEPNGTGLLGHLRPYANLLAGRGEIEYVSGGYVLPGIVYLSNQSAVYAAGFGGEVDVTRRFSVKADAQVQHWNAPVMPSGALHTSQGGVGIVYRCGTGGSPR